MNRCLPLAAAILLLAAGARAQVAGDTATTVAAPSPTPAAEPAGTPAPAMPADGRTVSGVTVIPAQPKPCGSRDTACIALVVAQLKAQYPEELKKFCFGRDMRAVRTEFVADQINGAIGAGQDPPTPTSFGVNSALKAACTTDKKADAKTDKK